MLVATLREERRAEGGVHAGLELARRQELFGGHDRRESRARGGSPNRSGHRQRPLVGATPYAREDHARLTYAGGDSSVTGRLGERQLALTLSIPKEEDEAQTVVFVVKLSYGRALLEPFVCVCVCVL